MIFLGIRKISYAGGWLGRPRVHNLPGAAVRHVRLDQAIRPANMENVQNCSIMPYNTKIGLLQSHDN